MQLLWAEIGTATTAKTCPGQGHAEKLRVDGLRKKVPGGPGGDEITAGQGSAECGAASSGGLAGTSQSFDFCSKRNAHVLPFFWV